MDYLTSTGKNIREKYKKKITDETIKHLIELVYSQTNIALFISLFCATIILIRLFNSHQNFVLLTWFVIFIMATIARFVLVMVFTRRKNKEGNIFFWRRLLILEALARGLTWGIGSALLVANSNTSQQITVILTLACITAASAPYLAGVLFAEIIFVLTSLLPLIILFSFSDLALSFATLSYLAFLVMISVKINQTLKNMHSLQFDLHQSNKELMASNQNLELDIKQRIETEKEVEILNQKLLISARQAGMADVAISTLHNVGNILNSVGVSIALMCELTDKSNLRQLIESLKMLSTHAENLTQFLIEDEKGKFLPKYIFLLNEQIEEEQQKIKQELQHLNVNVRHISEIICNQQSLSGVATIEEKVYLPNLIDTAIQMSGSFMDKNSNITLKKEFKEVPTITTDRNKVLQILVNLILNAKDALLLANYPIPDKTILIQLEDCTDLGINIIVKDNGIGIASKNLTSIFGFGFTIKSTGHGFGLHSSAISAKDLGGNLHAQSAGLKKGATFTLTLPYAIKKKVPSKIFHQPIKEVD